MSHNSHKRPIVVTIIDTNLTRRFRGSPKAAKAAGYDIDNWTKVRIAGSEPYWHNNGKLCATYSRRNPCHAVRSVPAFDYAQGRL